MGSQTLLRGKNFLRVSTLHFWTIVPKETKFVSNVPSVVGAVFQENR
jgi:hypothetical protein